MEAYEKSQEKIRQLYRRYEQPMYRIAYAILHQSEQAEDAVSDAFLQILKNLSKIDTPESEQTKHYVVQIIRRTAINQYRKNAKEASRTTPWDERVLQIPDETNDTEAIFARAVEQETMASLFDNLRDNEREIVWLHCQKELTFSEIAERLSIRESTARKRFERAKKSILKQIEKGEISYEIQQPSTS